MKLENIIRKEHQIISDGNSIENNIIKGADISIIGHFNNCVSLNVWCSNVCAYHDINDTKDIGFKIRALIELFDLTEEDGFVFSKFKDIPCRLIFENGGGWGSKCIGFGHFMKDKFVYKNDFKNIDA